MYKVSMYFFSNYCEEDPIWSQRTYHIANVQHFSEHRARLKNTKVVCFQSFIPGLIIHFKRSLNAIREKS
jgi:hypothetical protein